MCCPRFCALLRPSAVRVLIRSRSKLNCALASTICLTMANRSSAAREALKASWMICKPHVGPYVAHCSRLLHPHPRLGFVFGYAFAELPSNHRLRFDGPLSASANSDPASLMRSSS
jgi:hypothetical protein